MDSLVKFLHSPFPHFVDVVFKHPTSKKLVKLHKKLPVDAHTEAFIQNLQKQYPYPFELQVYRSNGTSFKRNLEIPSIPMSYPTHSSFPIEQEDDSFLGTVSPRSTHQPASQPRQRESSPAGANNALTQFILSEKDARLREKEELIKDQKDEIKILKESLQREKEKAWEFEKELKFKDKEHELDKYSQELEGSKGLNGVIDRITEKPELLMGIMQMVTMFSGKPMPQLGLPQSQPAEHPQPGAANNNFSFAPSITADHQAVIDQIVSYLQNTTEEVAAKFYAIFLQLSQQPYNLQRTLEFLKN